MPTRGDKFGVIYVDGDVPQLPIQLGQLLVDSSLVSPGNPSLKQCTDVSPVTYETVSGGGGGPSPANPTATVGPAATNGVATTYMRSDAAPALANTAVAAGTYTYAGITVDAQGRLTAASSGSTPATQDETIRYALAGGAATPDTIGLVITSAGTDQTPTMANTSAFTRQPRRRRITSTAGNQVAGYRSSTPDQFPNRDLGFTQRVLFGSVSNASGQRLLVGSNSTGVSILAANDPSTETDFFAFAKDVADTNLQFMHNDSTGAATKIDLGFTWASLSGVLLLATFSCTPGASGITYSLRNCNTQAVIASGTVSSNIPTSDVFVGPQCFVGNAATAAAVSMEMAYIDSRTRFP